MKKSIARSFAVSTIFFPLVALSSNAWVSTTIESIQASPVGGTYIYIPVADATTSHNCGGSYNMFEVTTAKNGVTADGAKLLASYALTAYTTKSKVSLNYETNASLTGPCAIYQIYLKP